MVSTTQRSFAGGEVAPSFHGRVDTDRYASSLKTIRNFIVTKQGSLAKRPGMQYVDTIVNAIGVKRLIPFVFSDGQAYLVVATATDFLVYSQGARVARTGDGSWTAGATYPLNQVVAYGGKTWKSLQANNLAHQPDISPTWWAEEPYVWMPHGYAATDLMALRWAQSGDVLTLVHPGYAPMELKRYAHGQWALAAAKLPAPGDYAVTNLTVVSGPAEALPWHPAKSWTWGVVAVVKYSNGAWLEQYVGASVASSAMGLGPDTAPVHLTWTAVTPPSGNSADVYYRVFRGHDGVLGFVGETSSAAFDDHGGAPDYTVSPLQCLEEDTTLLTGVDKRPASAAYFAQRLWFAGSNLRPAGLWASKTSAFASFTESEFGMAREDDALSLRLAAYRFEQVLNLVPLRKLFALTSGGAWEIALGQGPIPAELRQVSHRGCHGKLPALVVDNTVLFVDPMGNRVWSLPFSNERGGPVDQELSFLASHLLDGHTIVDWCYQERPHSIVWMVRDDGKLLGMTYVEGQLLAWHQHDTGGVGALEAEPTAQNPAPLGQILAVCSLPESGSDVLYLLVQRTFGYSLERMVPSTASGYEDAVHLDCSSLAWDGRNSSWPALRMNSATQLVALQAGTFSAGDVGKRFVLYDKVVGTPLVVLVTAFTDAQTLVVSVVSGTWSDYSGAFGVSVWSRMATSAPLVARFGSFAAAGVVVAYDGHTARGLSQDGFTLSLDEWMRFARVGYQFSAELEFLDPAAGQASPGLQLKQSTKLALDFIGAGQPSLGAALPIPTPGYTDFQVGPADLTPEVEEADFVQGVPTTMRRRIRADLVTHSYSAEACGALRQRRPFPLTILGVTREVKYGAP